MTSHIERDVSSGDLALFAAGNSVQAHSPVKDSSKTHEIIDETSFVVTASTPKSPLKQHHHVGSSTTTIVENSIVPRYENASELSASISKQSHQEETNDVSKPERGSSQRRREDYDKEMALERGSSQRRSVNSDQLPTAIIARFRVDYAEPSLPP